MTTVTPHSVPRTIGGLVAVALGLLVAWPTAAVGEQVRPSYGHTHEADGTLRSGCHRYRYHYVVSTPTNDWALETFLHDPTGDTLASGTFLSDSDPRKGSGVFRFCRYSTRPGRFTIQAKVHWYGEFGQEHTARFEPSHFRLRLAR